VIGGLAPVAVSVPPPLACAAGREDCALVDRTVLILTRDQEAWHRAAAALDGLGLRLRSCEASTPSPLAAREPVDVIVIDTELGADVAFTAIDALVAERPWVPVLAWVGGELAVRLHTDGRRPAMVPEGSADAQPLRRAVARSLCRAARHGRHARDCLGTAPE
jgi:hypothetical protein